MPSILIADPDSGFAGSLGKTLEGRNYHVAVAQSSSAVFEEVSRTQFDYVVLDVRLLEKEEISLLYFLRSRLPRAQLILTSSPESAETAMRAAKQGAYLSILKPFRAEDLMAVLGRLKFGVAEDELPGEDDGHPFSFYEIVGKSAGMRRVLHLAAKVAKTDSTVILVGETGTGKELVARIIQRLSRRSDNPFVTLNCGALPENLLESELFGHKKGAFTDAIQDKKGLLEVAHMGTLFLDEVSELPQSAQVKLLRVLEGMEIRRVGDLKPIHVDVRILAATNRDLSFEVKNGRFREDLWFRLNVIQINIPPLRERREDIPVLLRFFLNEANRRFGKSVIGVSPEALIVIGNYDFPGNVRELQNMVYHGVVMADHDTLRVGDLPVHIVANSSRFKLLGQSAAVSEGVPGGDFTFRTIQEVEKELIHRTLEKSDGNQTEAAKRLGISRSTLWRKLKEYNITV